jgi:hypothetical protein
MPTPCQECRTAPFSLQRQERWSVRDPTCKEWTILLALEIMLCLWQLTVWMRLTIFAIGIVMGPPFVLACVAWLVYHVGVITFVPTAFLLGGLVIMVADASFVDPLLRPQQVEISLPIMLTSDDRDSKLSFATRDNKENEKPVRLVMSLDRADVKRLQEVMAENYLNKNKRKNKNEKVQRVKQTKTATTTTLIEFG